MTNGWAFEVSVEYIGGGLSPSQVWYVAICDKEKALTKLKEEIKATDDVKIEAKGELSENTLKGIRLESGKTMQWI